ncbi:purine-nucleoside phosphorylase [Brevibacterium daeguense]|uniref:Purine nucleoside phosphorylase n=1 Tax=Brevibacterium daeguense TaxID=909936 RepID=A0ABP8EFZ4_9MICO|nr:purine-nucleoside phosphorylase [Brevibacterium daeguense]
MTDSELHDPTVQAQDAAAMLNAAADIPAHDIALVLGSGWAGAAELIGETISELPASQVPGFHWPTVAGHSGALRTIRIRDTDRHALVLGARTHLYEGRGVRAVAHGVRTAAAAGCSTLVLTNGCGGLLPAWQPGTTVLISDHLNLTGVSPIEGPDFVDLTDLYSSRLRGLAREVDPSLPEGVYAQFPGPHYETPAEVRMAGILGADLVGMSTTLEAVAARQAGMEILGISLVTNAAAGVTPAALSHEEVVASGVAAGPRISGLLARIIGRIARDEERV